MAELAELFKLSILRAGPGAEKATTHLPQASGEPTGLPYA